MKADVESAKAAGTVAFEKLSKLAELEKCAAGGMGGGALSVSVSGHTEPEQVSSSHHDTTETLDSRRPHISPPSPHSTWYTERLGIKCCSEDEDEEIDVDD